MAYYNPQVMPPTQVPTMRSNPQPPAVDPARSKPGISPQVAALMRTAQPGGGYDNIGVPLSTLHGQVPGAGPVQPVQPGQMFQNAQMANAQFQNAQSKPMQMPPPQQSLAQRQAATVSGIANRPGVSPQVAALMRAHPSQGQSNDLPPPPMNRMRALR
jgi:hypothetical protein